MELLNEVEKGTKEFKKDNYAMSIGEIANLYKDKEIVINPEFQRYYRWTLEQKSNFIESILLGIPIPPIFVYQRSNGVWELVDGLQRISTILEFIGLLEEKKYLILNGTKYLPSLKGIQWPSVPIKI